MTKIQKNTNITLIIFKRIIVGTTKIDSFFIFITTFALMNLVTGGTGLLGAHLLLHLSQKELPIRAIYRLKSKIDYTKEVFKSSGNAIELFENIQWVRADVLDITSLEESFRDITHVYHAAGVVSFSESGKGKMFKVNGEGTTNMVNLAMRYNITKFCYASSILTLPNNKINVTEDDVKNDRPSLLSSYAASKYIGEMEVWRASQEGLNTLVVNPGIILGDRLPHNNFINDIIRVTRRLKPKCYLPGSTAYIGANDLAKAMIQLMNTPITNNQFIIVSGSLSFRNIHGMLAKNFGFRIPEKSCPKLFLMLLDKVEMFISFFTHRRRLLSKEIIHMFYTNITYESTKIKSIIDFEFTPVKTLFRRFFDKMD